VDATAWPGIPVASWPPAVPRKPFAPPSGRGTPRLIGTENTGRCPLCGYAVRLCLDGRIVAHKTAVGHCPGSGEPPADGAPLACWLPVRAGLTPHGHKTWMAEDGIPEILAEQRLGHLSEASGGATLHQLRHSALTHDAEQGTGTPMLMARSGHTSVRSLASPTVGSSRNSTRGSDTSARAISRRRRWPPL
jgi:hypothetical protein